MIVGQKKLLSKIDSMNIDSFSHSFILLGERGCGKKTFAKYISKKLNLEIIDITDNLSLEFITAIYERSVPALYMINTLKITEKDQNTILKLLEEPPINAFIALLCSNKNLLLDTVLNRCRIFEFEQYTRDDMSYFIEEGMEEYSDIILDICKTPGQLTYLNYKTLPKMKTLCDKIASQIGKASYNNIFTISSKINYGEEFDKYDILIFLDSLADSLFKKYIETNEKKIYDMYMITIDYRSKLRDYRLNKETLFDNYISNL